MNDVLVALNVWLLLYFVMVILCPVKRLKNVLIRK